MEEDEYDWVDSGGEDDKPNGTSARTEDVAKRACVEREHKTIHSQRHGKHQKRLPNDLNELRKAERDIRAANVGQQLSDNVSRRVLLAAFVMQLDYVENIQKEGGNSSRKIAPPRVRESVCRLLGLGPITYNKIIHACFNEEKRGAASCPAFYTPSGGKGNTNSKTTRIPEIMKVCFAICDFVRFKRAQHERITARQVLGFLVAKKWLVVATEEDGSYERKSM
uniref:Predicted protein putative n=1 Tax=Albugo laibachii Nc14 TaxID=890382 RepID=F0WWD1_9STRA|nr:predicted protein putative [Albugo laibachii Nc14]|eukprot:CCA25751.1 predicted protein putative [Albugo laibachii Nc14]